MGVFTIISIQTKSGTTIELPPSGILCVVGGNNVGKSQFLRDIPAHLNAHNGYSSTVLVEAVHFTIALNTQSAVDWLIASSVEVTDGRAAPRYKALGGDNHIAPQDFAAMVQNSRLSGVLDWFVRKLDASDRSAIATIQAGSGNVRDRSHALNELFRDGDLAAELSAICDKAFGFPLTLDRVNGNVMLRVGHPGMTSPPLEHPTREYSDRVANLPPLHEQGDGVKNYLGMVLHMMTSIESVTIFDEPEAFLHPAQARALGRHLGREANKNNRQLIAATHDRDFILGLLDSKTPLTVLRINRDGDTNTFTSIDSEVIADIWAKPALRYSNLLQGLFHRIVVLCEADADCHWYRAVTDSVGEEMGVPTEEILFVPGGGKDQLPSSLMALHALQVLVFTITDFDSLLNPRYIASLLEAKQVRDDDLIEKVKNLANKLTNDGRLDDAKKYGFTGVPSGNTTTSARAIVDRLRDNNILIVPTGELESFDRSVGGHGPSWVSAALNKASHESCTEAKNLVDGVVRSLAKSAGQDVSSTYGE